MFVKKLQLSGIIGGVLGALAMIGTLSQGKGLGEAFSMIPVCMLIALVGVFWFTRNMDGSGEMVERSTDQQIVKLQRDLRKAIESQMLMERQGNPQGAAYWRSEAAVLESRLRSLGA